MKYITVDMAAIDEIVASRFLQSVEFPAGSALAAMIKGQLPVAPISNAIAVTKLSDGVFITAKSVKAESRYIVIDLEQSEIFHDVGDAEALFIFQKLLRFAKKMWQGLSLNFGERIINGTSKAVLFPFRGFKQAPFRVTVERDPMSDRLSKRGHKGSFLLAYKAGHEGADGSREVAGLTNFRKAYEALPELRKQLTSAVSQDPEQSASVNQLQVAQLRDPGESASLYRLYEDWLPILTEQQKKFVQAPIAGPFRIEGAAGTGKTLVLMLKALHTIREAEAAGREAHLVFITHSDATKRSITEVLAVMGAKNINSDRTLFRQTLKVCTLSELCADQLKQNISESEFIDRDAMESKGLQLLYIAEAYEEAMKADFPSHERFLSRELSSFLQTEDSWKIVQMLQHEISVIIKGRASEDIDRYKKIPSLRYGLPISGDADKGFVFTVFRSYQAKLGGVGQFDTDDVVLTAIGQLDTPIWRRRRVRDGFDYIFVDETHLFNINELHLFHYFTKVEGPYPIVYSVDRSQAVGDQGWTSDDIAESISGLDGTESEKIRTIFRSSPDIVNLAFSVVSSGATLFTNFDNPVDVAASGFTDAEERLAKRPQYLNYPNEEALVEGAFATAERVQDEMGGRRSDVLIVTLDENLLGRIVEFAKERNKAAAVLTKRGDTQAVEGARQASQFVVAHADYVGGLEFHAVVLVGVDNGRVPPGTSQNESSKNYLSYAAHNRLYVAVTRARYRVVMLGEKARGPSRILDTAINSDLLVVSDAP